MANTPTEQSVWIYTNLIGRYTSIHRAHCGFCNAGEGVAGGRNEFQSGWRGPFPTVDLAVQQVMLNKHVVKEVRYCRRCL